MRASQSAGLDQEKLHETQAPHIPANHTQAAHRLAAPQSGTNCSRCLLYLESISPDQSQLATVVLRDERNRVQTPPEVREAKCTPQAASC